jgi:hypothetical protein
MRMLAIVAALLCVLPVAAKTLNVGPDAEYTKIDAALSAASKGDVISVAAGYYEVPDGIDIEKDNITLEGAGADKTILDGVGEAYSVVGIKAKNITVSGFTLQNGSSHGFYASENSYANLHHNVITGCKDRGILLGSGKPYAIIDHNTFANNKVSTIYSYRDDARTEFTNNISYDNGRSIVTDSTVSHMTIKYNCFYAGTNDSLPARTSKTNMRKDPLFVDAESDFHLRDGSPCLGAGKDGSDIGALGKGKNPVIEKTVATKATGVYKIVVYADDEDLGKKVLDVLLAGGFGSSESYVTEGPNDDANIKYGAATKDDIKAMRKLVSVFYDGKLEEMEEFDEDDYDVFINLP